MPIDQNKIESEITTGLRNERDDLARRRARARSYDGDFDSDFRSWEFAGEARRESRIFRRAVEVLTRHLYKDGPTRTVADAPEVSTWLEAQYQAIGLNALLSEADKLSLANDVAAVEVYGETGEESLERPIGVDVWGSEDLCIWLDPDNARKVGAVAVLDEFDEQRRLRLWTTAQRVTYLTEPMRPGQTAGGTNYRVSDRIPNPYGMLPFAFFHATYPARMFWSRGPGEYLRKLNYHLNYRLTQQADDIIFNRPIGLIVGGNPDFKLPKGRKAGEFSVVPGNVDAGGNGPDVEATYLTCDLGYTEQDAADLNGYLDHAMEMIGLPAASIRMQQTSAGSGIQLVAEQIPLIEWAEQRQRPFGIYENRLAKLFLRVAMVHAEANGLPEIGGIGIEALDVASEGFQLSLRWPDLRRPLPGPERDQTDQFRLDNRLVSRTQLLQERENLTRDEAEAKLDQISEDLEREKELFADLDPMSAFAPAANSNSNPTPPETTPDNGEAQQQ